MAEDLTLALRGVDGHGRALLDALFGTVDATAISGALSGLVAGSLAPVRRTVFVRFGVGLVVGLELTDDRAVVVKVHRWNVTVERLRAMQRVQSVLADHGAPAPRPLVAPAPLAGGVATIEEFRPGGRADGHDPIVRRAVARGLAELHRAAARCDPAPSLGRGFLSRRRDAPLWDEPHDVRFDFDATAAGAEWIDALATEARATLAVTRLPDTITHLDWRVENLGFDGHDVTAIYDWDSVASVPEAVAVGQAAAGFSTDWAGSGAASIPSLDEMRAFVADYEESCGRVFTRSERVVLDAANLMLCAYAARCQHSDRLLHPDLAGPDHSGWSALLRARGLVGLR